MVLAWLKSLFFPETSDPEALFDEASDGLTSHISRIKIHNDALTKKQRDIQDQINKTTKRIKRQGASAKKHQAKGENNAGNDCKADVEASRVRLEQLKLALEACRQQSRELMDLRRELEMDSADLRRDKVIYRAAVDLQQSGSPTRHGVPLDSVYQDLRSLLGELGKKFDRVEQLLRRPIPGEPDTPGPS